MTRTGALGCVVLLLTGCQDPARPIAGSGVAAELSPPLNPGSRIVFGSRRADEIAQIYAMNGDGSGLTQLTSDDANKSQPRWSPDGKEIAFNSDRTGANEVWVMNADGSNQTRLTFSGAGFGAASASWSPDGKRMAFQSDRDGGIDKIFVMNADGSGVTQLTSELAQA